MSNRIGLPNPYIKPKQRGQLLKISRRAPNPINQPLCDQSQSAMVDIVILIVITSASGFLLYPSVKFIYQQIGEYWDPVVCLVKEELYENPVIYGSLCFSMLFVMAASWVIVICLSRKCGDPNCKGLKNAAEFDIQLETEEDCVKNFNPLDKNSVTKKGLFELPGDHHHKLEGQLKKIAPVNGRAVFVFRARCGCSIGRMEVPGPRKARKTKK